MIATAHTVKSFVDFTRALGWQTTSNHADPAGLSLASASTKSPAGLVVAIRAGDHVGSLMVSVMSPFPSSSAMMYASDLVKIDKLIALLSAQH